MTSLSLDTEWNVVPKAGRSCSALKGPGWSRPIRADKAVGLSGSGLKLRLLWSLGLGLVLLTILATWCVAECLSKHNETDERFMTQPTVYLYQVYENSWILAVPCIVEAGELVSNPKLQLAVCLGPAATMIRGSTWAVSMWASMRGDACERLAGQPSNFAAKCERSA